MEAFIGIFGGLLVIVIALLCSKLSLPVSKKEFNLPEDTRPLKTYTIIDNYGEKQIIMSRKSLQEVTEELKNLSK